MELSANESGSKDEWVVEPVDKGLVGEYASHVIESNGKVHIAYYDYINGNLRHAQKGPDGWLIETVDQEGTVGQYISMAKDKEDKIYISYRDQGKNRLKIAVLDGNNWNIEVVDNEPFASLDTSIFVDDGGTVYIGYYNFNQGYLKLATRSNNQWKIEVVDDGQKKSNAVGGFPSVKVDSIGRIHISYIDSVNYILKYAVKQDNTWNIEIVDDSESVSNFTSLALDQSGNPYISYTVDKRPNKPDLWLAKRIEGKWLVELVDTEEVAGNYCSLVLDDCSNIYITYSFMKKLKFAKNIHGLWSFDLVDPSGTITYTSLSIDADGMPYIVYCDKDRGVKYAHR
jgi:hypothetical protein